MKGIICYYSSSGNTRLACEYIERKVSNCSFDLFDILKDGTPDLEDVFRSALSNIEKSLASLVKSLPIET